MAYPTAAELRRLTPDALRLDGEVVHPSRRRTRWQALADLIRVRGPDIVEALDSDGAVTKVWRADEGEPDVTPPRSPSSEVGTLSAIADLLERAADRAAARHEAAYRAGFEAQQRLVELLLRRVERPPTVVVEEQAPSQSPQEESSGLDTLAAAVLEAALRQPNGGGKEVPNA